MVYFVEFTFVADDEPMTNRYLIRAKDNAEALHVAKREVQAIYGTIACVAIWVEPVHGCTIDEDLKLIGWE